MKSAAFGRQTAPPHLCPIVAGQLRAGHNCVPRVKALCPSLCSSCRLKGAPNSRRGHNRRDQTDDCSRSFASIRPSRRNERADWCLSIDVPTRLCAGESQCAKDLECCWNPRNQSCAFGVRILQCCWNRKSQPCNSSDQCDPGGEGCITDGAQTKKFGVVSCQIPVPRPFTTTFAPRGASRRRHSLCKAMSCAPLVHQQPAFTRNRLMRRHRNHISRHYVIDVVGWP